MNIVLLSIFLYILFQVIISAFLIRRISTEKDYFVAGQSLGLVLVTFSVFATWFGAETCMGSAGAIFEKGLSAGRADPFGYTICLMLMGFIFASKLWKKNIITLADLFRIRFSKRVEILAVLIMVPSSLMWAAAQIRGFGQVISASSNHNIQTAMMIATFLTIAYTMFGGLMADVLTDFVQGLILIIGLLSLFIIVIFSLDHPFHLFSSIDPAKLSLFPADGTPLSSRIEGWMGPILGSLVTQELIARIVASRTPRIAKQSCLLASGIYLTIGLIPIILGLIGSLLFLDLKEPEQLLPMMAKQYLPFSLYIVFIGALISAILSTVDSVLLAISSLVSHNLIIPAFKKPPSEKKKVLLARVCVVTAGIFAYIIAIHATSIYTLINETSIFGSSGILIITVFGLFSTFGREWSAVFSIISGFLSLILCKYIWTTDMPFLISLTVAFVFYVGVEIIQRVLESFKLPQEQF